MSIMDDHCGECGIDPCVCHGPLDDDDGEQPRGSFSSEEKPNPRKRVGAKEPLSLKESQVIDLVDEDEEVLEHNKAYQKKFKQTLLCSESYNPEPDLDVYFEEYGLSAESRIAMCRTYANYLTQKLRSSGRLGPPRQKRLGWTPKTK